MVQTPILVILVVGVARFAGLGWVLLAPKPEEHRQEAAPAGSPVAEGAFHDGEPLHHASGTVKLVSTGTGHLLLFETYEATPGPDVYFFLTPLAHATTSTEVEGDGVKVRTPTMIGQATLRGDIDLDLPEGLDVSGYRGIAVCCQNYNVLFGVAQLAPS